MTGQGGGAGHTRGRMLMTVWSTESHRYDRPGGGAAHTRGRMLMTLWLTESHRYDRTGGGGRGCTHKGMYADDCLVNRVTQV